MLQHRLADALRDAAMHLAVQNERIDRLAAVVDRSEEHTSELQSQSNLVCRLLLETQKIYSGDHPTLDPGTSTVLHSSLHSPPPTLPAGLRMLTGCID